MKKLLIISLLFVFKTFSQTSNIAGLMPGSSKELRIQQGTRTPLVIQNPNYNITTRTGLGLAFGDVDLGKDEHGNSVILTRNVQGKIIS